MTSLHESELHRKEADYHDEWALTTPLDRILVRECFESPAAVENRFIISQMGSLKGKKVLDIGAGLGESSVYFALQGAVVTAVDVSPRMVETVVKLGKHYGVEINGTLPARSLAMSPPYGLATRRPQPMVRYSSRWPRAARRPIASPRSRLS